MRAMVGSHNRAAHRAKFQEGAKPIADILEHADSVEPFMMALDPGKLRAGTSTIDGLPYSYRGAPKGPDFARHLTAIVLRPESFSLQQRPAFFDLRSSSGTGAEQDRLTL